MTAGRMLALVCVGVVLALLLTVVVVARAQDGARPSPVTRHLDKELHVACYTTPALDAISCVHIPDARTGTKPSGPSQAGQETR
jgi:hypothetical protein